MLTKWLKYGIIILLNFNTNHMSRGENRNRAVRENAALYRAGKAELKAEMNKSAKIGDKMAQIKAYQAEAHARLEAADDEKLGKEVERAFDKIIQTDEPANTQSKHFMNPNVGKAVGDAFSKFEGQESLGKLKKEDIELAVKNGLVEEGEGVQLQRAIDNFKAGKKDPETEAEINRLLEKISAM